MEAASIEEKRRGALRRQSSHNSEPANMGSYADLLHFINSKEVAEYILRPPEELNVDVVVGLAGALAIQDPICPDESTLQQWTANPSTPLEQALLPM